MKLIALSLLAGIVLIVLLQNTQVVDFQLLFWKISMSRIIFLVLFLLAGFGLGFIVGKKSVF
ncbi:MAG: lipopolysaccharide assembly protein LapA domain-containing protein [Candidatus Omnitrophica bacterium]|nr:lipopolysaccharide assembly protein LapA domain-containing protein [Candidatus Omnitrophota bacterium]